MEFDLLISVPLIVANVVDFTRLKLNFFDVFVAAKCVDLGGPYTYGRKERLFLDHRGAVDDILVDVLKTIVAHSSN